MAEELTRYKALPLPLRVYFLAAVAIGIVLSVYCVFGFRIKGFVFLNSGYYFLLFGIFISCVFLILPKNRKLLWYDLVLSVVILAICLYFFSKANEIAMIGWSPASTFNLILGVIFLVIVLEGCRRASGSIAVPIVAILFGIYPLIASFFPGILCGIQYSFPRAVSFYVFSEDGVLGIPGRIMGNILIGFLILTGFLLASGAGKYFIDVALALLGKYRGGPAKVSILSSALFGMLSGSPGANVVGTGTFTIPAMKRTGYPPHYAGAVEACASTGGGIMPPVMGTVAFVMAAFIQVPYSTVVVAAIIPAILYYYGLMVQADVYAAKIGIKGLPKEEIPSLWGVLKKAWPLALVIVFLIWGLIFMRWENDTPYYATGLLLVLCFANRETMITPRKFIEGLYVTGRTITTIMNIILPAGIIIAAIKATGVGAAFTSGIVTVGGGNLYLIMLIGVAACYVMGMVGLLISAYIFLAMTLAPAMIQLGGLNVIAVHLFIVYYTLLSFITPPVASAAFVASAIAGAPAMKVGLTSMRLGIVLLFIPFFFVFKPALILQGSLLETIYLFALCLIGIAFLGAGLEGYLWKLGKIQIWTRVLIIIGGFLIALPEGFSSIAGAVIVILTLVIALRRKRFKTEQSVAIK